MTTLLTALLTSLAVSGSMTPAQTIATDYITMTTLAQEYDADRQYYQDNKDFCNRESSYFTFSWNVYCDQIPAHFIERRNQIGNLTMRINGNCDEHFNTSDMDRCMMRVERNLIK